jgi:hypothetical protein
VEGHGGQCGAEATRLLRVIKMGGFTVPFTECGEALAGNPSAW